MKKNWLDFDDLDSIFKVTLGLGMLKNGLSASYFLKDDSTSTKLAQIRCWVMVKHWLEFVDLDSFF